MRLGPAPRCGRRSRRDERRQTRALASLSFIFVPGTLCDATAWLPSGTQPKRCDGFARIRAASWSIRRRCATLDYPPIERLVALPRRTSGARPADATLLRVLSFGANVENPSAHNVGDGMAASGHEDQFPRPSLNDRCRLGEETFARMGGKEEHAPIPAVRGATINPEAWPKGTTPGSA